MASTKKERKDKTIYKKINKFFDYKKISKTYVLENIYFLTITKYSIHKKLTILTISF